MHVLLLLILWTATMNEFSTGTVRGNYWSGDTTTAEAMNKSFWVQVTHAPATGPLYYGKEVYPVKGGFTTLSGGRQEYFLTANAETLTVGQYVKIERAYLDYTTGRWIHVVVAESVTSGTLLKVRGGTGTEYSFPPNTILQIGEASVFTLIQSGTTVTIPNATVATGGVVNNILQDFGGVKRFDKVVTGSHTDPGYAELTCVGDGWWYNTLSSYSTGGGNPETLAFDRGGAVRVFASATNPFDGTFNAITQASLMAVEDVTGIVGGPFKGAVLETKGDNSALVGTLSLFFDLLSHRLILLGGEATANGQASVAYAVIDRSATLYVGDYYTDSIGNVFKGGLHIGTTTPGSGGSGGGGGTITRISKGTAVANADSATLAGVSIAGGTMMIVVYGSKDLLSSPVVSFNGSSSGWTYFNQAVTGGGGGIAYLAIGSTTTGDVEVTCGSATDVAFAVIQVNALSSNVRDKFVSSFLNAGSTTPTSTATGSTVFANEYWQGAVITIGDVADANGTWSNSFTDGGQTAGNANIRVSEGYFIASAVAAATAAKTGITSRPWAALVETFN